MGRKKKINTNEEIQEETQEEIRQKEVMKNLKEAAKVMMAYANGKEVQRRDYGQTEWIDEDSPAWDWASAEYRIKPEPKYREYRNAFELLDAIKEHGDWVIDKQNKEWIEKLTDISDNKLRLKRYGEVSYQKALEILTFVDGTRFGIMVEEKGGETM